MATNDTELNDLADRGVIHPADLGEDPPQGVLVPALRMGVALDPGVVPAVDPNHGASSIDTYSYVCSTKAAWQVANTGGSGTTTSSALDAIGARTAIAGASLTGCLAFDLHGNLVAADNGSKVVTDALRYGARGGGPRPDDFGYAHALALPGPTRPQPRRRQPAV